MLLPTTFLVFLSIYKSIIEVASPLFLIYELIKLPGQLIIIVLLLLTYSIGWTAWEWAPKIISTPKSVNILFHFCWKVSGLCENCDP